MNIDPRNLPEAAQRQYREQVNGEIAPSQERRLRGHQAQVAGQGFERQVEDTFEAYRALGIARLFRAAVPTAPAPPGLVERGYRVLSGQALWDVFGWFCDGTGFIGAELKHTAEKKPSLPIIAEGMRRGGLQEHQMNALASLAGDSGTARVVWWNGSEAGILYESEILAADERFYEGGYASRSIKWELFQPVQDLPPAAGGRSD